MSTAATGRRAEAAAAAFLERRGCRILARNWHTRSCEIDIIAERAGLVYFCEVKYRRTVQQGTGLEYITPQKLQRMYFAARQWLATDGLYRGYRLSAIEVSGPQFRITAAIPDVG